MKWKVLFAVIVVVYLATGVTQVRPEERAVVRRFGKVVARPGPGLWIGLPWGIDRVDRVPVKTVRQATIGFDINSANDSETPRGQYLTGDQNLVNATVVVAYEVDETDGPLEAYVLAKDRAESILTRETEALLAAWLAARPVDDALLTGRAAIPAWLTERLATALVPHRLGIVVSRVSIDYLAPPEEVREAFEAVTQAQAGIRTRENQARQEADRRLRFASTVAFEAAQQSEAYRTEQLTRSTADAQAFTTRLQQFRTLQVTNPNVLAGIWWDELGKMLLGMKGRGRIDLLDHHLGKDGLDITQFLPTKKP